MSGNIGANPVKVQRNQSNPTMFNKIVVFFQ
ncbi:acetolactate synthase [Shigella sonnei]|nr:acetolactate synthase [Shigella sonnei]